MGIVVTQKGAKFILNSFLNGDNSSKNLTARLFVNDIIPTSTQTEKNFVEAKGGGYASKFLLAGGWYIDILDSTASFKEQVWKFTSELTENKIIYGYYVLDNKGNLLWGERFKEYYIPMKDGSKLIWFPKIQIFLD